MIMEVNGAMVAEVEKDQTNQIIIEKALENSNIKGHRLIKDIKTEEIQNLKRNNLNKGVIRGTAIE